MTGLNFERWRCWDLRTRISVCRSDSFLILFRKFYQNRKIFETATARFLTLNVILCCSWSSFYPNIQFSEAIWAYRRDRKFLSSYFDFQFAFIHFLHWHSLNFFSSSSSCVIRDHVDLTLRTVHEIQTVLDVQYEELFSIVGRASEISISSHSLRYPTISCDFAKVFFLAAWQWWLIFECNDRVTLFVTSSVPTHCHWMIKCWIYQDGSAV
jgi:hypothetical protein